MDLIQSILDQAVKASALERLRSPKLSDSERHERFCAVLDYARWQVAVNGGRWIDYANPFEAKLVEAWKI